MSKRKAGSSRRRSARLQNIADDGEFLKEAFSLAESGDLKALEEYDDKDRVDRFLQKNAAGNTILHVAAAFGQLSVIKWLISKKGMKPSLVLDVDGRNALHRAVQFSQLDVIKWFTSSSSAGYIDPTSSDTNGRTSISYACQAGDLKVLKYLDGLTSKVKGFSPLLPDSTGKSLLHYACRGGHIEVCKWIIAHYDADVYAHSKTGKSILHYAAVARQASMVEFIIKELKVSPNFVNDDGSVPLNSAALFDRTDVVEALISLGASTAVPGYLFYLVQRPNEVNAIRLKDVLEKIQLTLIDLPNMAGKTPFQIVANKASDALYERDMLTHQYAREMEILLLRYGANPFQSSEADRTAWSGSSDLHLAIWHNPLVILEDFIVQHKDNINSQRDALRRTPLHHACSPIVPIQVDQEWVQLLLKHGADPRIQDDEGWTPLHEAVASRKVDLVNMLIDAAPELLEVRTYRGDTPLDLAIPGFWDFLLNRDEFKLAGNVRRTLIARGASRHFPRLFLIKIPRLILYLFLSLIAGLFFPVIVIAGAMNPKYSLSEILTSMKLGWIITPNLFTLSAFVAFASIFVFPLSILRLDRFETYTAIMLPYGWVLVIASVLFLGLLAVRSWNEPRFLFLPHPSDTIYISFRGTKPAGKKQKEKEEEGRTARFTRGLKNRAMQARAFTSPKIIEEEQEALIQERLASNSIAENGETSAANKVKAEKEKVKDASNKLARRTEALREEYRIRAGKASKRARSRARSFFNVFAIMSILVETFQQSAFSFLPEVPAWSSDEFSISAIFRASILSLGFDTFRTSWIIAMSTWAIWQFFASYLCLAIMVHRSGPAYRRPWLRRLFPFITNDFFADLPASSVIIPVVGNTLFIPITKTLLTALDCSIRFRKDGTPFYQLDSDSTVFCYEGPHLWYLASSITAYTFYLPTSVFIGFFFLYGDGDIRYTGRFQLLQKCLKLILVLFGTFATNLPKVVLLVAYTVDMFLVFLTVLMAPCQHIRVINIWKTASYLMAAWSVACAVIAVAIDNPESFVPISMYFAGIAFIAVAFFTMQQFPETFQFVSVRRTLAEMKAPTFWSGKYEFESEMRTHGGRSVGTGGSVGTFATSGTGRDNEDLAMLGQSITHKGISHSVKMESAKREVGATRDKEDQDQDEDKGKGKDRDSDEEEGGSGSRRKKRRGGSKRRGSSGSSRRRGSSGSVRRARVKAKREEVLKATSEQANIAFADRLDL